MILPPRISLSFCWSWVWKKRSKTPDIPTNFGRRLPCLCKKPWLHRDLCEWLWLVVAFSWSVPRRPCCPHPPRCPPQKTGPQRGRRHQTTRLSHCFSQRWTWQNASGPPLVEPSIARVFLLDPGPVRLAWKQFTIELQVLPKKTVKNPRAGVFRFSPNNLLTIYLETSI